MRVDLFDYDLPAERIAQEARPRGASRLLVLDRKSGSVSHRMFTHLPELLAPGDLLVRNDVRVRPARLWGRDGQGRLVEIFLLESLDSEGRRWLALAKPGRRARPGQRVEFDGGIDAVVAEVRRDGRREIVFERAVDDALLERIGHVPLPPYIRRVPGAEDRPEDREAYQTIFAREPLAVAAPTAGLHFTADMFERLAERAVSVADLTLAVGAGTFKPVTVQDTVGHTLEAERTTLPDRTQRQILQTRRSGRRVVAVGTTVVRALEAAARRPEGFSGDEDLTFSADLFITPGFVFEVVDVLLTNFHLPRSTLLMLAAAFAGREAILAAYAEAIRREYLFYSFGDAMLIT